MDSNLISQAQIRAGSKVHDVSGLVNAYGLWEGLALRGDTAATIVVRHIECALRRFIVTGSIGHVSDLPTPPDPRRAVGDLAHRVLAARAVPVVARRFASRKAAACFAQAAHGAEATELLRH